MKKSSWTKSARSCTEGHALQRRKKFLKRQRSKKRRQSSDMDGFEKTTDAFDLS